MNKDLAVVVDLDDTLVYTKDFNNDAYNYALEKHGYPRIDTDARITRKDLLWLPPSALETVIREKQYYFAQEWMPYRVLLNTELLEIMEGFKNGGCYLWTAADEKRASKIISHFGLERRFTKIMFDNKANTLKSVSMMRRYTNAKYALALDDEIRFSKGKEICRLKYHKFDIGAWLIKL